jgi:branched-chain amino acid transport system ATP-binding protein
MTSALEIQGLSLNFGGLAALSEVSLTVAAGQTVGLVGANGSGKTSLLNCISGIYQPQAGRICIHGTLTSGMAPHQIAALGVGRTLQSVEVIRNMPVLSYVMLGRHQRQPGRVLRYLSGWPSLSGGEERERNRAMGQLEAMGLAEFAAARMADVPYGMAKLADLARVLLGEPRLLLLDEPASGLSSGERVKIAGLLRDIGQDAGRALVVVEHDLALAARTCDVMLVLSAGKQIALGRPQEVLASPVVVDQLLGGAPLEDLPPGTGPGTTADTTPGPELAKARAPEERT